MSERTRVFWKGVPGKGVFGAMAGLDRGMRGHRRNGAGDTTVPAENIRSGYAPFRQLQKESGLLCLHTDKCCRWMGLGDWQSDLHESADVHLDCLMHPLFLSPRESFPLRYTREDPMNTPENSSRPFLLRFGNLYIV